MRQRTLEPGRLKHAISRALDKVAIYESVRYEIRTIIVDNTVTNVTAVMNRTRASCPCEVHTIYHYISGYRWQTGVTNVCG